ncbi:hypothetical protein HZ326_18750 [Fusarium oxysporum f. sp. albedinis]|nr:hypothetical protein HZ326_18750 [Fusarium oxysporum f. sp. albedinis]
MHPGILTTPTQRHAMNQITPTRAKKQKYVTCSLQYSKVMGFLRVPFHMLMRLTMKQTPDQTVIHERHVAFGGLQHNGQIRYVGPDSGQANSEQRHVMYRDCVQFGPGDQHNGDIVYHAGGYGKTSTTTTYDSMICGSTKISDNLPDGNSEITGTQHNGPIIRSGKKQDFE